MNIFVTNSNYILAAQDLDDKRLVKMILESTQMLCTAANEYGSKTPYKSTHLKHPCTKWVMESYHNFLWLYNYTRELCDKYSRVYGKTHKCLGVINSISIPEIKSYPIIPRTPFPNCTTNKENNINYKHITNTEEAYRCYLIARWNTDKRPPTWFKYKYNHFIYISNPSAPEWVGLDKQGKFFYKGANYEVLYNDSNSSNNT